jgi:hypothetical protein
MSTFARSVLFVILILGSAGLVLPSIAQSVETKSQVPARTKVDGKFERYLESPGGDIEGIVLEDGTVARFAPFKRAPQSTLLRRGDSVRAEGDVASGLTGPYLVHAVVTRIEVPTTRGAVSPTPHAGPAGNGAGSRHAGKGAKGSLKGSLQPPRVVVVRPSVSTRKKGRLETIESKARDATTGTGKSDDYSRWSRTQETAGP